MFRVNNPFVRWLTYTGMILCLLSIAGCDGCWRKSEQKTEEEQKKEEQAKKRQLPDIEMTNALTMPGIISDPEFVIKERRKSRKDPILKEIEALKRRVRDRSYAKPGHWHDIRLPVIANHFDVQGELRCFSASQSDPIPVESTPFAVNTSRPFALTKGEWKTFESSIYFPNYDRQTNTKTFLCELRGQGLATGEATVLEGPNRLAPFQHHLVVLSANPDRCRFVEMAPTIRMPEPKGGFSMVDFPEHYVVIPSTSGLPVPLPRHALSWTTIAYLIWDDLDPDELGQDQQTALLDWLHFGGQLIISGQDSLERLENSFLGPYLPATAGAAVKLDEKAFAELNQNWSLREKGDKEKVRKILVSKKRPMLGIELSAHKDAKFVQGTGSLVVERQLGRGRIVATAFSIKSPAIKTWRSFDNFLHNVLMRQKSRVFIGDRDFREEFTYQWTNDSAHVDDPMLCSTLRFLSRDLAPIGGTSRRTQAFAYEKTKKTPENDSSSGNNSDGQKRNPSASYRDISDHWHYGGYDVHSESGLGGWNDRDGVAAAARATLLDAAGIAPPSSNLVLQLLAGYLFVLVPLNWFVFWMLGRVEWAWIAAPLIAVVGAVVVIRMASLDIGFTASNTQVCLLELQTGYERGHLTEYSALYTSLSTSYDVKMGTPGAQALPFPSRVGLVFKKSETEPLVIDQQASNSLKDIQIQSNSTQLIHSEQIVNTGGTIRLETLGDGTLQLVNESAIDLEDVLVVHRPDTAENRSFFTQLRENTPRPVTTEQDAQIQRAVADRLAKMGTIKIASVAKLESKSKVTLKFSEHQNTQDLTSGMTSYFDPEQHAEQCWVKEFAQRTSATLDQVCNMEVVAGRGEDYRNWLMTQDPDLDATSISMGQFKEVYQELNPIEGVTLGRMLNRIDQTLTLPTGQFRLYASSPGAIGGASIEPASTQTDRQTLVVVHLTHPNMGKIDRDANSPADFGINAELDDEKEEDNFDQSSLIE